MKVGLYLYFVHIDAKNQKKIRALHEISKAEKTIKKDCTIAYEMKERERWRRRRRCHAPPRYRRGLSHETNAGERWANMSQTTEEGWRVAAMV